MKINTMVFVSRGAFLVKTALEILLAYETIFFFGSNRG